MSSRRSRFKVQANIPVRRKLGLTITPAESETPHENIIEEKSPNSIDEVEGNLLQGAEEAPTPIPVAETTEKVAFKRIKPRVFLPIKKQRSRIDQFDATSDKEGSDAVIPEISVGLASNDSVDSGVYTSETLCAQNFDDNRGTYVHQNSTEPLNLRPLTPVTSLATPLSPLKSSIRPRFGRHSFYAVHASSASESEDDNRRSVLIPSPGRARKVSESSVVSKSTLPTVPPVGSTDSEFKRLSSFFKRKIGKPSYFVRRLAEARRDFSRKFENRKPERSSLKMFDLIFYNPANNPLEPASSPKVNNDNVTSITSENDERLNEENLDNPDSAEDVDSSTVEEEPAVPVPQVKIGANGEIILDEKSVVIETTEAKKGREALMNSVPIFEDRNRKVSYYSKKKSKSKDWSPFETKSFYKALNSIGTDFALMQSLFPTRSRVELKNKYKREERLNSHLIDTALSQPTEFNIKTVKEEIERERIIVEEVARQIEENRLREEKEKKELRVLKKTQRESQAMLPPSENFIERFKRSRPIRKASRRSTLGEDFLDPDELCEDSENHSPKRKILKNMYMTPIHLVDGTLTPAPSPTIQENRSRSVSCSSDNDLTESVTNAEFLSLISRNADNFQQSTIQVLPGKRGINVVLKDPPTSVSYNNPVALRLKAAETKILDSAILGNTQVMIRNVSEPSQNVIIKKERFNPMENCKYETLCTFLPKTEPLEMVPKPSNPPYHCIRRIPPINSFCSAGDDFQTECDSVPVSESSTTDTVPIVQNAMSVPTIVNMKYSSCAPTSYSSEFIDGGSNINTPDFTPKSSSLVCEGSINNPVDLNQRDSYDDIERGIGMHNVEFAFKSPPVCTYSQIDRTKFRPAVAFKRFSRPINRVHSKETYNRSNDHEISHLLNANDTGLDLTMKMPPSQFIEEMMETMPDSEQSLGHESITMETTPDSEQSLGHESITMESTPDSEQSLGHESITMESTPDSEQSLGHQSITMETTPDSEQSLGHQSITMETTPDSEQILDHQSITNPTQLFSETTFDSFHNLDHESISNPPELALETTYNSSYNSPDPLDISSNSNILHKSSTGIQYAVLDADTDSAKKRTFLAGLQPGSFVFMSREGTGLPIEKRCSMYMIAEKVLPNGTKEYAPMPVVLPPELMNIIVDELKSS